MPVLTHDGSRFIFQCTYDERLTAKNARFLFDSIDRVWFSKDPRDAAKLRFYADEPASEKLEQVLLTVKPWSGRVPHPKGLTPLPFQLEDVAWAMGRNRCYLGLDPGLGKTIEAALLQNTLGLPCVYVCPPFLVPNVRNEFAKWGVGGLPLYLFPDSMLSRKKSDTWAGLEAFLKVNPGAFLVVDEAHRFKEQTSKRTQALFEDVAPLFKRAVYMSGTPMPNRPVELFTVLRNAAPETIGFRNFFDYARRYCAAHKTQFGWDFTGAANMDELSRNVKAQFMRRRRKADVLTQLPARLEEAVVIGENLPPELVALERRLLVDVAGSVDVMKAALGSEHVMTYRRKLGTLKAPLAAAFVKSILEETPESVLVFTLHRDVAACLEKELASYQPAVITGDTNPATRQTLVDRFQRGETRLVIGNIQASGVGFTMTEGTRVVFAEFDWVPGNNDQAIDRAHRIGQTERVLAQYLVFKNSLDRQVLDSVLSKRSITAKI